MHPGQSSWNIKKPSGETQEGLARKMMHPLKPLDFKDRKCCMFRQVLEKLPDEAMILYNLGREFCSSKDIVAELCPAQP